jgi:RimJ/RimL family protein N-acetyltransferase
VTPEPAAYTTFPPQPMPVAPVTLAGRTVRLEPLSLEHVEGLWAVAQEPAIWRWMPVQPRQASDMQAIVEAALAAQARGAELPFATIERRSGRPIGSSRYLAIDRLNHRLEIGWTWLGAAWQRTAANTEAKLLMLGQAFEVLACNRVEFKTDVLNAPSRTAIVGLGARFEGIFRNHMIVPGGRLRDSAYYAITVEEWPAVKAGLEARLARHRTP